MRIGEFAGKCGTKISVLRHYDKTGLLKPVYIDRFTEYRYYASSQIAVFNRIQELKNAGFSLAEIKQMLYSPETIDSLFAQRRDSLTAMLETLGKLQEKMNGGISMKQIFKPLNEDVSMPFVNDPMAVGKWQETGRNSRNIPDSDNYPTFVLGDGDGYLYFLPRGEQYWCFSWTKGKLIFAGGESSFANDYRIEAKEDGVYMTVDFKSLDYNETAEITAVTLKKVDSREYTAEEIARKDDINKPFVNDDRVLGRWVAFCYFDPADMKKEEFVPYENPPAGGWNYENDNLYFKEIEFDQGGRCTSVYGSEKIKGDDKQTWTKGYVLRKWNSCALAYDIKVFEGREYLIIEWKSGDYRFGGRQTSYYVMVRE